jgi:hypothetical protein
MQDPKFLVTHYRSTLDRNGNENNVPGDCEDVEFTLPEMVKEWGLSTDVINALLTFDDESNIEDLCLGSSINEQGRVELSVIQVEYLGE